jgi:hypothetical protein
LPQLIYLVKRYANNWRGHERHSEAFWRWRSGAECQCVSIRDRSQGSCHKAASHQNAMHWTASSEKDTDNAALEKRLGAAANRFCANYHLKPREYSASVLELSSIVCPLTEVIEPYRGRILEAACGAGSMFVSSGRSAMEHSQESLFKAQPSLQTFLCKSPTKLFRT